MVRNDSTCCIVSPSLALLNAKVSSKFCLGLTDLQIGVFMRPVLQVKVQWSAKSVLTNHLMPSVQSYHWCALALLGLTKRWWRFFRASDLRICMGSTAWEVKAFREWISECNSKYSEDPVPAWPQYVLLHIVYHCYVIPSDHELILLWNAISVHTLQVHHSCVDCCCNSAIIMF